MAQAIVLIEEILILHTEGAELGFIEKVFHDKVVELRAIPTHERREVNNDGVGGCGGEVSRDGLSVMKQLRVNCLLTSFSFFFTELNALNEPTSHHEIRKGEFVKCELPLELPARVRVREGAPRQELRIFLNPKLEILCECESLRVENTREAESAE
jgi:hypothetical protein